LPKLGGGYPSRVKDLSRRNVAINILIGIHSFAVAIELYAKCVNHFQMSEQTLLTLYIKFTDPDFNNTVHGNFRLFEIGKIMINKSVGMWLKTENSIWKLSQFDAFANCDFSLAFLNGVF